MTDEATFSVTLAEREILFRHPIAGQLIVLRRRALRLQQQAASADERQQALLSSDLILNQLELVESLIINPEDAVFLEEAMLQGKVGHEELLDVLRVKQEPQKAVKATTKKAAPKKAASKATANRARTKR